ncbi:MAG: hypothetical protein ABIG11_03350 [bacterium]
MVLKIRIQTAQESRLGSTGHGGRSPEWLNSCRARQCFIKEPEETGSEAANDNCKSNKFRR